jgi:hypothetical protein
MVEMSTPRSSARRLAIGVIAGFFGSGSGGTYYSTTGSDLGAAGVETAL